MYNVNEIFGSMNPMCSMTDVQKRLNDFTFSDYYHRLRLLATTVYEWQGLPNGIDENWIEKFLFNQGWCAFFEDKEKGFMVAKCNVAGNLNYYDEPTKIKPYGTNYDGNVLDTYDDAIIIRNNDLFLPTAPTIQLYALRLAELTRTIDININAQKTPVLIKCSEKQRTTLLNVYKQWNGNQPVIFGDKQLETEGFDVLNTGAPVVFDKLQHQKHEIWNECMTFLGINNSNQDKRERLVADEVAANDEQIQLSSQVALKSREKACELINEKFGLNVTVKLRDIDVEEAELQKEGEPDD